MTGFDFIYLVVTVIMSLWIGLRLNISAASGTPLLMRLFVFVAPFAMFAGVAFIFFGWTHKIREHCEAKRIASLPRHTVEGKIISSMWCDTGRLESRIVPTGGSILPDGKYIAHEIYESDSIYDGAMITVEPDDTHCPIYIRTMKKHYQQDNGDILTLHKELNQIGFPMYSDMFSTYRIVYATDTDGTNYFIRAKCLS